MPSSLAFRSEVMTTAAAPSFRGHELPAVTRPFSRKTGFKVASTSMVVLGRGPSSRRMVDPFGSGTGMISRSKNPPSRDCTARVWLFTA